MLAFLYDFPRLFLCPQGQLAIHTNALAVEHPDYSILAARALVSNIHKATLKSFSRWVTTYGTGRLLFCLVVSFLT